MKRDREDPEVLAGRLELQSTLLDLLRRDLEAARQANEAKDRASLETWRRLRLHEMLVEESRQELLHLRSTLSWKLTAPLRRLPRLGKASTTPRDDLRNGPEPFCAASPVHLDFMEEALRHLHAKGFRPRVVLDVGAAKGHWSERAARVFPEAAFYLFDPLKESEPALRALSKGDSRFHHFLMALGRERGTLPMNVGRDPEASSLLDFPGQDQAARRPVPVETVDGLLAAGRISRPDLVKLDVQGFELEVLAGGAALFDGACVFIVEVNLFEFMPRCPLAHEVVAYFGERGYRVFDVAGLLRRPFQHDLGQMDLVFVPRDSPLVAESRWS
jgi:FkbM family methyltransferase